MEIEPHLKFNGAAFVGNRRMGTRPLSRIDEQDYVNVISLKEFCDRNFISRDTGYRLIELKLLIAFRRHNYWWIASNSDCLSQLLEYLGVEELFFDAVQ